MLIVSMICVVVSVILVAGPHDKPGDWLFVLFFVVFGAANLLVLVWRLCVVGEKVLVNPQLDGAGA